MQQPIRNPKPATEPARWVAGSALGVSDRHVRRLFDELRPLGAARKEGRVHFFQRNHPSVVKLVVKSRKDQSYEDLSGYTDKQVESARNKIKIVETGQAEIARRMAKTGCGLTVAKEWFCRIGSEEMGLGTLAVGSFRRWETIYQRAGAYKVRAFVDMRGRKTGQKPDCDHEAWEYFKSYYLDDNKLTLRLAYDLTAAESVTQEWAWPAYRTICLRVQKEIPETTLTLTRKGKAAFDAECLPRIRRTYDHVAAGDIWCADECTLDIYARAPNGDDGWKRVRPILTAWLDVRSRMFTGWHIAANANSDTIVASFKHGVRDFGPPLEVICDNGKDYKATAGRTGKRKWSSFNGARLEGIYSELGIKVHWAIPYTPQAKMIESHFRAVHERFDKLFESYCGNKPENRPEGVIGIRIDRLPTIDEVAERFADWLQAHHERIQTGNAMYGLSPIQAMEQFRSTTVQEAPTGDFLDFLCAKVVGPVKVTRNGVKHNVYYGQGNDTLKRLQGKEVLLKVQPDRADYVDVCDLEGRPLVRATNDRLTGVEQQDIRKAMSRRKRARKIAREYAKEVPAMARRSDVSAAIAAQQSRNKAVQEEFQPPDPPESVQLVRPDPPESVQLVRPDLREGVAKLTGTDGPSNPVRSTIERHSEMIDFDGIGKSFGLCGYDSAEQEDPADLQDADAILGSGTLLSEDEQVTDDDTGDAMPADAYLARGSLLGEQARDDDTEGDPPVDAFEILGRSIHEQRKRA